jgi:hypothetical protein
MGHSTMARGSSPRYGGHGSQPRGGVGQGVGLIEGAGLKVGVGLIEVGGWGVSVGLADGAGLTDEVGVGVIVGRTGWRRWSSAAGSTVGVGFG